MHKCMRRGARGGGAVAPRLWRDFQKSSPFGQIFAPSRARVSANNGLCVGPPPRFILPVRLWIHGTHRLKPKNELARPRPGS